MESIFVQGCQNTEDFGCVETYAKFLDNYFITNNNLTDLYYPLTDIKDSKSFADTLGLINQLSEIQQIYEDLDVNITKCFNFPKQEPHAGACFECIYVMEGCAQLQLAEREFELKAGDFIFHAPGDLYALGAEENSIVINLDMRKSYIYEVYPRLFAGCPAALDFFDACFRKDVAGNYLLFHTGNQKEFRETVMRIFIEYLWGDHYRGEIIRANFEILTAYLKRYITAEVETVRVLSISEKNYNLILDYLIRNYREATLDSAAETIHFSKQYIAKIIRQTNGSSFSKLLKSIRVEKIKEYLLETSLSLENIAELTGFTNTSYLWRTFKENTGISPSDYRMKNQK